MMNLDTIPKKWLLLAAVFLLAGSVCLLSTVGACKKAAPVVDEPEPVTAGDDASAGDDDSAD